MPYSSFLTPPAGLSPEQQQQWTRRQYVAECAIDFLAAKDQPLNDSVLAHLQDYVSGEASLGQAIGRLVDYFARESDGGLQPLAS
ncbi:hypothetical protein Q3A66_14020 [Hymenobacter sp. BT770]|uniref:hypothetical protein n=1 Tax=Hymenobacter sp. BT770 TaxID=2886942 RepID=UPI001D12D28A|nr:hypothetical protein [Hymenobacter sp. BT770]MCC3154038.1 hypothetical protein [Hymenobacter sp. BT770]MDO3416182.1 hypothetical protein [Hymenobacter sp. BT770]